jgi:hypothetical protein
VKPGIDYVAILNQIFGGGPIQKSVGDVLAREGANVMTFFGSSEGGLMNQVFSSQYSVKASPLVNPIFCRQSRPRVGMVQVLLFV